MYVHQDDCGLFFPTLLPASDLHHSSSAAFLGAGIDKDLFSCLSFKGLQVTYVPKTTLFPLTFKTISLFIFFKSLPVTVL